MLFGSTKLIGKLRLVNVHKRVRRAVDPRKPHSVDIFIGRPSVLRNTYVKGVDGDRDEVCDKYEARLAKKVKRKDTEIMAALFEIVALLKKGHDVNLVCFCEPKRCHGLSVIKQVNRLMVKS